MASGRRTDIGSATRERDVVFEVTADNRRLAAVMFESLSEDQWEVPSLCAGWTVRDIAAHLVMPFEVSFRRFVLALVRERGDGDRVADKATRELARRPTAELVELLRSNANRRVSPPGVGPGGQRSEERRVGKECRSRWSQYH